MNFSHISWVHILKSKRCFDVKFSTYYFHVKTEIFADFQICISVPLILKICLGKPCKLIEHLWWRFSTKVFNDWKPLTVNAKRLHQLGSKYASEGFLISVWFPPFHHTLSKEPLEVDLKWISLKWNWLLLKIISGGQKVFYIKKEKNYLSDLSHDVRKSFSANESYYIYYIKDLKPAAVTYAFL